MPSEPLQTLVYLFGPFRLDPAERQLLRAGQAVPLTTKAFETLVTLVAHGNHVVEKEELLRCVWPDSFVEEATLAQNVFTLRKALGDTSESPRYIETVPKVGYRFVAPIERREPLSPNASPPAVRASRRIGWQLPVAGTAALVIAALALWHWGPVRAPNKVMLAVLPFENLSGDPSQEYLGDGLTEEMITRLGQLRPDRLGVIARTTAMTYKRTNRSAAEIGRELGVHFLLEGSVRRAGDRVRISAQLISLPDQTHIWSESYERDVRDVLVLESEVAGAIARQVDVRLTPASRQRLAQARTVEPEAYELYLKGRYYWNQRNTEGTPIAREYFHRAIERDPSDARSYAGLAETYAGSSWADMQQSAVPAVARALELDDSLADVHTSNAIFRMYGYDWAGSEKEFRRAIELDPNSVPARIWHAELLQATGKNDEAVIELKRALDIDPLSVIANQALGSTLYYARRYDESAAALHRTLQLDPHFFWANLRLARVYEQQGRLAEAVTEFMKTTGSPQTASPLRLAHAQALWGKRQEALAQVSLPTNRDSYDAALVYVALGDRSMAFSILEHSVELHDVNIIYLKADPEVDPLRSEPRFSALLRRAGLL